MQSVKVNRRWRTVVAVIRDLQGMAWVVYQVKHGQPRLGIAHVGNVGPWRAI